MTKEILSQFEIAGFIVNEAGRAMPESLGQDSLGLCGKGPVCERAGMARGGARQLLAHFMLRGARRLRESTLC